MVVSLPTQVLSLGAIRSIPPNGGGLPGLREKSPPSDFSAMAFSSAECCIT
jgi:hypothetical protein